MISTFDLTLLGSLVTVGGLLFLLQAKWPHLRWKRLHGRRYPDPIPAPESLDRLGRSAAVAGARWLTVGALTLFVAYTRGAEEGYLFGPWGDVMFHVIFLSSCWAATVFRINQAAERPTCQTHDRPISTVSLTETNPSHTSR
jgi:hypothetical protein